MKYFDPFGFFPGKIYTDAPLKLPSAHLKPLDPIIKQYWVRELRSGKYKKCKIFHKRRKFLLFGEPRYCALGVLYKITGSYDLPLELEKIIWDLNDALNMSFEEIADWVEAHL